MNHNELSSRTGRPSSPGRSFADGSRELGQRATSIADIMTREVITVYEEENLEGLADGMQHYGFHHLPVVDGEQLVGLVTHRDLLRVAVSELLRDRQGLSRVLAEHFVRSIMRRDLITATPQMPLDDAARTMRESRIGCLPVVERDGTLVGIVTASDFLRLVEEIPR